MIVYELRIHATNEVIRVATKSDKDSQVMKNIRRKGLKVKDYSIIKIIRGSRLKFTILDMRTQVQTQVDNTEEYYEKLCNLL